MNLSAAQRKELQWTAKHGTPAHVRTKALVLLRLGERRTPTEVARWLGVSRPAVYQWRARYLSQGVEGFQIRSGRGRKPRADPEEIERHLRQSPRRFGVRRTRWTLQSLADTVPSLRGFSAYGVQKALERLGYRYKRGQPWLHSPDPEYEKKKRRSTRR